MSISTLFFAVVEWMDAAGAKDLAQLPGLWVGKTQEAASIGSIDVSFNPHDVDIQDIPPFHARLTMDAFFPGLIAVVGPGGGMLIGSANPAENEQGLISHFEAQLPLLRGGVDG
jgi:hypothetical protein